MHRRLPIALGLAALALASAAAAQPRPAAAPAAVAPARTALPPPPAAPMVPEVERRVIEDDGVRIEELRVRGEVRSVIVQSKLGDVRPYEIIVGRGGRDPSQDKSAAGQRVWSLLKF